MSATETVNEHEEVGGAGILNRIIARSIDFLIVGALFEIAPKAGFFAGIVYILIADGLFEGRSIGKKLIGIRVVLCDASVACSYRESILRNLLFALGFLLFVLLREIPLLGWLLSAVIPVLILSVEGLIIIGNEKGMRFGDEIAKTRVIDN